MRISMASALLAIGTLTLPAAARAQGDQALGFRAGQWGADFQVAGGFTGAGAIKFTSPTRAWLIDLGSQVLHSSTTQPTGNGSGTVINLSVKVGRRMYGTITHRVAPWTAVGLIASYGRERDSGGDTTTSFGAGVFGSLGATWLITPHLGIGAQWSLIFNYSHQSITNPITGTAKNNTVNVTLPNMALGGQLYF